MAFILSPFGFCNHIAALMTHWLIITSTAPLSSTMPLFASVHTELYALSPISYSDYYASIDLHHVHSSRHKIL